MLLIEEAKRLRDVGAAFALCRDMLARERWPRERLLAWQRRRLAELVSFARGASPFYRRLYGGVDAAEVRPEQLPTVSKAAWMAAYDDVVTDRRLRLADLERHVEGVAGDALYLGDFRVMASSGSTGRKGIYVYDRAAWRWMIAGMLRCSAMVGVRPRVPRVRVATVAAPDAKHMTFRASATLDFGLHNTLRLAATDPLEHLVARLNVHRPELLTAYPSVAAMLAVEQLEGRLRIAPRVVVTTSELRTPDMLERIRAAWHIEPYDLLALTETGIVALDCERHAGLHLFEDTCLFEVVDEVGRAVPAGTRGARVLVTNLYNRVQPMIRVEVSDLITLDDAPCACGRATLRVRAIEGRSDDVLSFPVAGRAIAVHPIHLRGPLARVSAVRDYQVTQHPDRLLVSVVLAPDAEPEGARRTVERALTAQLATVGVAGVRIDVDVTPALVREGGGKLKLVRRATA